VIDGGKLNACGLLAPGIALDEVGGLSAFVWFAVHALASSATSATAKTDARRAPARGPPAPRRPAECTSVVAFTRGQDIRPSMRHPAETRERSLGDGSPFRR
jgi:hypothetical protein